MTPFATDITLTGPFRSPAQMLGAQEYGGHASIHDSGTAGELGLEGAPIEAPTHFSQFDPLAERIWGREWFEHGCISGHFTTMVVEGEQVQASLTLTGNGIARIAAVKADGATVMSGTASIGPDHAETELDARFIRQRPPGELFIIDQLEVGMRRSSRDVSVDHATGNGPLYPFSLDEKLARITEPHPWYTDDAGWLSPWGRAILPMEMISVLAHKVGVGWPLRSPALGLFLDLEVRLINGPVFVGQPYMVDHEIAGLGESRRTESYWTRTTLTDATTGMPVAVVLLHSGMFKESYPGYPAERLRELQRPEARQPSSATVERVESDDSARDPLVSEGSDVPAASEQTLVARARAGSEDAWETLYRQLYPRLFAYARRRVLSAEAADDAVSETMLRAVKRCSSFAGTEAGFDGWVFGVLRDVLGDAPRGRDPDTIDTTGSDTAKPFYEADERVELARARAAFDELDPDEQELLDLRVIAGLDPDGVAEALGRRPRIVRTLQTNALDRLRTIFEEQSEEQSSAH